MKKIKLINRDLKLKQLIYLKALLFVTIWILAILLNLTTSETSPRLLSIALIVWSSARLYYFAFYVIEKYVDEEFKFSGVFDFLVYLIQKRNKK